MNRLITVMACLTAAGWVLTKMGRADRPGRYPYLCVACGDVVNHPHHCGSY